MPTQNTLYLGANPQKLRCIEASDWPLSAAFNVLDKMKILPATVFSTLASSVLGVPYSQYILTPNSRTIRPATVYNINGTVHQAESLLQPNAETIFEGLSAATYDFGKNVAGIVSFNVSSAVSGSPGYIGISFTESSLWINSNGCDATADSGIDAPLWFQVGTEGQYTAAEEYQRGGFRYLNIYHNNTGSTTLSGLSIYFTAIPQYSDAQLDEGLYTGYFHSDDDLINRIWYAGAYTDQMCTIDSTAGDSLVHLGQVNSTSNVSTTLSWYNNYTIANGTSALVDGAKRDRLVWPGDIAISQPSVFVSTYDMETMRNSLDSLLVLQNASGALPYAGRPFAELANTWSFTYHLYSLIDIHDYFLYTGNLTYLASNWNAFKLALNFSLSFVDESGLAYVTTSADWLREGMGGRNIEANSILYYTLNLGSSLAQTINDTSSFVQSWPKTAAEIKSAANSILWDASMNLYRDNDSLPLTSLHPQDGNSWAVVSNITSNMDRAINISIALEARWGKYGPPAPEAGATVSPFISGFELQAHYLAGRPEVAVNLTRYMWGDFMLEDPRMTNSTFIEGYSTNGDLHYAPYTNDPRVSHAHGWSTGPTSTLTFFAAGLTVTSEAGKTWRVAPQLGGLRMANAGYQTSLGSFSSHVNATADGGLEIEIITPVNTLGTISLPYEGGTVSVNITKIGGGNFRPNGIGASAPSFHWMLDKSPTSNNWITIDGIDGGNYTVVYTTNR